MLNILKKIDLFKTPFEIKIYGFSQFSSLLGFFLTVITLGIGISVVVTQGSDLFYKLKPRVNTDILYLNVPDNYTVSDNGFAFAITFQDANYLKFFKDKKYYDVGFRNFKRILSKNEKTGEYISTITVDSLESEPCANNYDYYKSLFNYHANKTGDNYDKGLKNALLSQSICLKNTNLIIGGEFNSGFFSNIMFEIVKCTNKTEEEKIELKKNNIDYVECVSKEEQNKLIAGVDIQLLFTNYILNTNNYTYPYYSVLDNYFLKLDPTIFTHVDYYFKFQKLISDNGLIFENKIVDIVLSKDYFRELISLTPPPARVLNFYLNISKTKIEIRRYYMKAQELAALVGGLMKFCMICAEMISIFFNRHHVNINLINHLFLIKDDFTKDPELKVNKAYLNIKDQIKKTLKETIYSANKTILQDDNQNGENKSQRNCFSDNNKSDSNIDLKKCEVFNAEIQINTQNKISEKLNEKQSNNEISNFSQNLPLFNQEMKFVELNKKNLKDNSELVGNESALVRKSIFKLSDNSDANINFQKPKNSLKFQSKNNNEQSKSEVELKPYIKKKSKSYENLKITYCDIIFLTFCFCTDKYSKLKKRLLYYQEHLDSKTDYSIVLSEILSFKEFRKSLDNSVTK